MSWKANETEFKKQVAELTGKIEKLNEQIAIIQTRIDELRVPAAQVDREESAAVVNKLNNQIDHLQNQIDNESEKLKLERQKVTDHNTAIEKKREGLKYSSMADVLARVDELQNILSVSNLSLAMEKSVVKEISSMHNLIPQLKKEFAKIKRLAENKPSDIDEEAFNTKIKDLRTELAAKRKEKKLEMDRMREKTQSVVQERSSREAEIQKHINQSNELHKQLQEYAFELLTTEDKYVKAYEQFRKEDSAKQKKREEVTRRRNLLNMLTAEKEDLMVQLDSCTEPESTATYRKAIQLTAYCDQICTTPNVLKKSKAIGLDIISDFSIFDLDPPRSLEDIERIKEQLQQEIERGEGMILAQKQAVLDRRGELQRQVERVTDQISKVEGEVTAK